jgi:hypothetical protein
MGYVRFYFNLTRLRKFDIGYKSSNPTFEPKLQLGFRFFCENLGMHACLGVSFLRMLNVAPRFNLQFINMKLLKQTCQQYLTAIT